MAKKDSENAPNVLGIRLGVSDAWTSWILEHHVNLTELVKDSIKQSFEDWLSRTGDEILKQIVLVAMAPPGPPSIGFMDLYDDFIAALTVWREARGEPPDGRLAVAMVIRNRMKDPRWPDSASNVCLQAKQFSCFNLGDPNSVLFPTATGDESWKSSCVAWMKSKHLSLASDDLTHGANHYLNPNAGRPNWLDSSKVTMKIGNHTFLKL
jgi:hypothetical protein